MLLWAIAVAVTITVAALSPWSMVVKWPMWALLVGLAWVAEMKPVHFQRHGVQLSLSLPFVAGTLLLGGPLLAIFTEAIVLLLALVSRNSIHKPKRTWFWARLNLPIGMISAAVGALGWTAQQSSRADLPLIGLAAYVALYLTVNMLLVSRLNSMMGARSFWEEVRRGSTGAGLTAISYVTFALAVGALMVEGQFLAVPFLILPLMLLRHVVARHNQADELSYETMVALTIMLQRAHPYTHGHLERVGRTAEEVGLRLGIPRRRARMLREAAVLHDIGKIAVDEQILDKPSKLTESEYEHVKLHSEFGYRILLDSPRFSDLAPWILYHHERPDGKGYPHQLTDIEIPLESKIIAVADAYDAMSGGTESSEKRNYRPTLSPDSAMQELERCCGTQFDPRVVAAFRHVLTEQGVLSA